MAGANLKPCPEQGEATYYMHLQPYNSGPFTWPPPAMSTATVNGP